MKGKTVKYFYSRDCETVEGIVVGYDKQIGITIVNEDNPDYQLVCLHGPGSTDEVRKESMKDYYQRFFIYVTDCIEKNEPIETAVLSSLVYGEDGPPGFFLTVATCPF